MAVADTTKRARRLVDDLLRFIVIAVLWLLLLVFVIYPLGCLTVRAFSDDGHFTIAPLIAVLANVNHLYALRNSLLLAFLVAVLGTVAGFLFAFTAERAGLGRVPLKLLDVATLLPLISPPFTTSIAFVFSFGPRGLITHDLFGLQNTQVYGLTSTMVAEALTYFPLAYLALRPVMAAVGGDLEEAAYSLGASRWRVFRTVTVPLTTPGLANAFLLLFAASLADFATPLILAGNSLPVLPTEAYLQITGMFDLKGGAVLSLLLLVPAALVYVAQRYIVERRSYVTVTGKSGRPERHDAMARWVAWLLALLCLAIVAFVFYLYLLLFYASIVRAFGANDTMTLANYRVIFTDGVPAIKDTLIIAAIGMPLGGLYSVVIGYLVSRVRFPGRQAMEVISMINYALPGTIVGIAYLIAFNSKPLALTGTAAIIIACYVFRYSPSGIRTTVALLQQVDRSIEEASYSLGAGSFTTFRRVVLPLILPAFFAGLGVVFIRSMTAISATIFLVSINWTLITVRILENMTELSLGPAAAFSVFVIALVLVVTGLLNLLLRRMTVPATVAVGTWTMVDRNPPVGICLAGITATFRQRGRGDVVAVDAVDLTVEPGELLTLLGPSGCGKTTMLRMIAGFQEPSAGAILIGEQDVTRLPANRRDIGLVFQSYALFPHLTVFENVAYGLRVRRRSQTDIRAAVEDVLRLVGLDGFAGRLSNELSGGQQQRVALARAIVIEPRVLLFDEPLSNLDAKLRVEMRDEIRGLQRRLGITTVYVTHDQEEAMAISDRIAVMQGGRIVQLGTAETLYRHPASSFVAGFLGHANILRGIVRDAADRSVTIELAGQMITLPTTQVIPAETKLAAVIRPEAISIGAAGDGIRAKLTGRVYLGEKVEYTVEVGGVSLQIVHSDSPEGEALALGQDVSIRFPNTGVHLLVDDD